MQAYKPFPQETIDDLSVTCCIRSVYNATFPSSILIKCVWWFGLEGVSCPVPYTQLDVWMYFSVILVPILLKLSYLLPTATRQQRKDYVLCLSRSRTVESPVPLCGNLEAMQLHLLLRKNLPICYQECSQLTTHSHWLSGPIKLFKLRPFTYFSGSRQAMTELNGNTRIWSFLHSMTLVQEIFLLTLLWSLLRMSQSSFTE